MGPAANAVSRWTPCALWPVKSRAKVAFYYGEKRDVLRTAGRILGRRLETWQYAGLAGAPDGALVELGTYRRQLLLEMGDPAANRYRAFFLLRRVGSALVLVNDSFRIHAESMRRKGFATRVLHRQLANAACLGVARIETKAGRRCGENGYYTWPRLGFDGLLSQRTVRKLPLGFEHAQTVLDLMACEKGRLWWSEHGETIRVAFDLGAGSRSRDVFTRYTHEKWGSSPEFVGTSRAV